VAAGGDEGVKAVSLGDRDVVLGEVAGIGGQRGVRCQLKSDRLQVLRQLVEGILELRAVGRLV